LLCMEYFSHQLAFLLWNVFIVEVSVSACRSQSSIV
jgi:hypothetical protein